MGVFEQFPYTNIHNLNLDWILREVKTFAETLAEFRTEFNEGMASIPEVVQETGSSTDKVMSQDAVTKSLAALALLIGTVDAKVPNVVQTTGTSENNVMSQKAVTDLFNSLNINIVQTTGSSTTAVMSQKAVTDAISAIDVTDVEQIEHYRPVGSDITPDTTINDSYYSDTGNVVPMTDAHGHLVLSPEPGLYYIEATVEDAPPDHVPVAMTWPGSAPTTEGWLEWLRCDDPELYPNNSYFAGFIRVTPEAGCLTVNGFGGAVRIRLVEDPGHWLWDGLPNSSVTTNKLDNNAVTTAKISAGSVTSAKINAAARAPGVAVVTTAPTADNTEGLKFALLDAEPGTFYDGWVYLIKEATP